MKLTLLITLLVLAAASFAEFAPHSMGGYTVLQTATLKGAPEALFDAMTGDILPWWDHHFSEKPLALRLEPWAGGKFIEEFDDRGNGALHATVIYCERGKMIRFDGPLGTSGRAINMVTTYEYTPQGDSTEVKVTVNISGQIDEEHASRVDGVWRHFLIEAFKPYWENKK
jgi:hypothetical protein